MSELHVLNHPMIQHKLTLMRNKNTQTKKAAIIFLLLFSIAMASFPIKYQFIISAFPKKATYSRIFPCTKPP